MDDPKAIAYLINLYIQDKLSVQDAVAFNEWLSQQDTNPIILARIMESPQWKEDLALYYHLWKEENVNIRKNRIKNKLKHQLSAAEQPTVVYKAKRRAWLWYAAASILFVVGLTYFISVNKNGTPSTGKDLTLDIVDVKAGSNKAVLRLADGQTLALKESTQGIHMGNGISYENGEPLLSKEQLRLNNRSMNLVLEVPLKSYYQLILSDGTKVWVNAGSRLSYPVQFDGDKREVELEGEAYFEVAKSTKNGKRIPFFVKSKGQSLEVLGTKFNVSAYKTTVVKTTLLEGSIALSFLEIKNKPVRLLPGQQGTLTDHGFNVAQVDTRQAIAWKNGYFLFEASDAGEAFDQLERWYDIDVIYADQNPKVEFFGKIERNKNLSEVLDILKKSGLRFKVQNKGGRIQLLILGE